jgi:AcrR family transcriptional regulator
VSASSLPSSSTAPGDPGRARLPRPARRAQLLQAAQEVFVASGYHAAAMDDIAERAGVSKPVLYQHFPSKLELYLALLDSASSSLLGEVRAALASTSDNKLRAAAAMEAYFRYVDHEASAFRLVFESDLTNDDAVRQRVDRLTADCAEAISAIIIEDVGLGREESTLLAVGLVGMAQVAARYWLDTEGTIPRAEAARLVGTLAWRGIASFPLSGETQAPPPADSE